MNNFNDPVCSVHKNHLKDNPEHWCKEVLLYSPNNPDYNPESRVHLYAKPALTPEQIKAIKWVLSYYGDDAGIMPLKSLIEE